MNSTTNKNENCQSAINQLINQMEAEDFDQLRFDELVAQHADCQEELTATYELWQGLNEVATPVPRPEMSTDFYKKLNEYTAKNPVPNTAKTGIFAQLKNWNLGGSPQLNWLLGLGIFIFGFFAGNLFKTDTALENKVEILAKKMQQMEKEEAFQVNLQQSVSGRMKDIQFVKNIDRPNNKILEALNSALCNDPNINVRLSAIESLVYFAEDDAVMQILIKAITKQTSPIVQLELANVMIQLEEKRSADQWKALLESGNVELDVKMQLEESLQVLL